jgi:phosphoribosylformylglycinamidine synthase
VVDGLREACLTFGTPITGGNVSFYNETFEADIYPTPVVGMVGLVEDMAHVTRAAFSGEGDAIVLIETVRRTEDVDLEEERALQRLILALVRDRSISSAHDLAEGGFAVALAECCFGTLSRPPIGAVVVAPSRLEVLADLFGEFPTRVLVSAPDPGPVLERAAASGLEAHGVGRVGGDRLVMDYEGARALDIGIAELEALWRGAIPALMENAG